jgi:GTP cyclohydrolase II
MPFELRKAAEARLPTLFGDFDILGYEGLEDGRTEEAVVLRRGDVSSDDPPILRIHSQCLTGDVFHSLRCDCRAQLELAMREISTEGRGLIIYGMQEGRGIGIMNKIRAYALQDAGADTVEANVELGLEIDARSYRLPAEILRSLGVTRVRLISNNPQKVKALEDNGIEVVRLSAHTDAGEQALKYLQVKKEKLGHLIDGF